MSPCAAFRNGGLRAGAHRTRTGVSFFLVARLPRMERELSLTPHTPPLSLFLSSQLVALLRPASATTDLLLKLDKVRASVSGREREMVGAERGARGAHEKPGRAQKKQKNAPRPPPFPLSLSPLSLRRSTQDLEDLATQVALQDQVDAAVTAKAAVIAAARAKLETALDGADEKVAALKTRLEAKKARLKGKDPLTAGWEEGEGEVGPETQGGEPPEPVGESCPAGMVSVRRT